MAQESKKPFVIHCDGACRGNPGPAAWGAVIESPDGSIRETSGVIGQATSQVAELTAAIQSLKLTPVGAKVHLISDSQYVVKGLSEWVKGWERRGWRTASGSPVANEGLWRKLRDLDRARSVRMSWIKGYAGHPLNERADRLAAAALDGRSEQLEPLREAQAA